MRLTLALLLCAAPAAALESSAWCYGTGWVATQRYAPTKEAALRAMEDVRIIFDALAP